MKKQRRCVAIFAPKDREKKASKASVARTSDVYVSSWRFINNLDILNNNLIPRKGYSNIDLETKEGEVVETKV